MKIKLLLIQLNEINFDLVDKYLLSSKKKNFLNIKNLKDNFRSFNTYGEDKYEYLEPWIQWVSVYLGKKFDNHKIFRLGDIVNYPNEKQIFEKIEDRGFKVGAISSMNADNRLKNPAYFIADPWTDTISDNSGFSKRLTLMLKQTVNENASGKLSMKSILTIIEMILKTLNYNDTIYLLKLIFSSLYKPWNKSLVLDYLIHLTHIKFLKKKSPNFSSVFLNAGAHIQHHYFYNSKKINQLLKNPSWYIKSSHDPIEEMLEVYDRIIGDYIKLNKKNIKIIFSTGLRQIPYDRQKFYYRLRNHEIFLNKIGIKFFKVLPRMTRDFEIIFEDYELMKSSKQILQNIKCQKNKVNIFSEIEQRNKSLFVVLTYADEIKKDDYILIKDNLKINFFNEVFFVAIKNGIHDSKGYVFYSQDLDFIKPKNSVHISKIHDMILNQF